MEYTRIPGIKDGKAYVKNLFKQRLSNPSTEKCMRLLTEVELVKEMLPLVQMVLPDALNI